MKEVIVVATGGANLESVRSAFERLGAKPHLTQDPSVIADGERVVLPGVGAAGPAMARLHAAGLVETLRSLTQPVLGLCLGMQILFERSEEADTPCLGLLSSTVAALRSTQGHPVPHMGWNTLEVLQEDPLLDGVPKASYAYFAHGYAAGVTPEALASTEYGVPLAAAVRHKNFWGTQFHPERSGSTGARILENFLRL